MMPGFPRILIVKLSAIGDVVHTLPALNALRRHYPSAHITWLVEEAAADLVIGHKALDDVIVSRRKTWLPGLRGRGRHRHLTEIIRFIKKLRAERFDMIFDFQASFKGAVLVAMVRSRQKIGFGRGLEHQEGSYWVLNKRIPAVSMEIHALKRGLLMLEKIGIRNREIEYGIPIGEDDDRWVHTKLAALGISPETPIIVINPMAKWPTKLWVEARFVQLADQIATRFGRPLIFTGSREDRHGINAIISQLHQTAFNLAGETNLIQLAALLRRAEIMVTTDTGPMHIAAAVGTPVVALFGPTAPWRTGPYGDQHRIVTAKLNCAPCFKRTCPTAACMAGIRVEEILMKLDEMLKDNSS